MPALVSNSIDLEDIRRLLGKPWTGIAMSIAINCYGIRFTQVPKVNMAQQPSYLPNNGAGVLHYLCRL